MYIYCFTLLLQVKPFFVGENLLYPKVLGYELPGVNPKGFQVNSFNLKTEGSERQTYNSRIKTPLLPLSDHCTQEYKDWWVNWWYSKEVFLEQA